MIPPRLARLDILAATTRTRWNLGKYNAAASLAAKATPHAQSRARIALPQQDLRFISDGQLNILCGVMPGAPGESDPACHPHQSSVLE